MKKQTKSKTCHQLSWMDCKLTSVRFYFPWRKAWKTREEPVVLPLAPRRSAGDVVCVSVNFTSSISALCPSILAVLRELSQYVSAPWSRGDQRWHHPLSSTAGVQKRGQIWPTICTNVQPFSYCGTCISNILLL